MSLKVAVVTGADGFIGSHLVEALVRDGRQVRALNFYNARGLRGWLDDLHPDLLSAIEICDGDVRDAEQMRRLIKGADQVFHLAALIGIPYSYHAPRSYVDTNVTGTLNILEACREAEVERALVVSTSEVYGTAREVPIMETHPLQGQSPYSASKIGAEKLAESYGCAFDLPVTVVRPFNTYGPRQSARAVIPTILMQATAGADVIELGDARPTRDFNYVEETAEGMIRLVECDAARGKVVNVGTGVEISIEGLVGLVGEILGRELSIRQAEGRQRPPGSEVERLCAGNSKLKALTGWVPALPLREGLVRTLEWIDRNQHYFDASRYYV